MYLHFYSGEKHKKLCLETPFVLISIYICFLVGKSSLMMLQGWLRRTAYQNYVINFMTTPPICHYSSLITTACHYLHYSPDSLFAICNYALSAIQVFQKPKGHIVRLCVNTLCVKTLSLQHVNNIQNLSGILRLMFRKTEYSLLPQAK